MKSFFYLFLLMQITCCSSGFPSQPPPKEVVLTKKQTIIIVNNSGNVEISFKDDFRRSFKYKNISWVEELEVRPSRWMGILGVYSPGIRPFSKEAVVNRLVYIECVKDFSSETEALDWLMQEWNHKKMKLVWTKNGLVGGFCETPARRQLNVDLYLITVKGVSLKEFPILNSNLGSVNIIVDMDKPISR